MRRCFVLVLAGCAVHPVQGAYTDDPAEALKHLPEGIRGFIEAAKSDKKKVVAVTLGCVARLQSHGCTGCVSWCLVGPARSFSFSVGRSSSSVLVVGIRIILSCELFRPFPPPQVRATFVCAKGIQSSR